MLAGGAAAGQLIALAASPVITRLYSPEEFATLALFATVVSCIAPIVCLRYESAISVPEDDRDAGKLLIASLASTVAIALLTLAMVAIGGKWFAVVCKAPQSAPYFWFLPISLLGIGLYQTLTYWSIRNREFGLNGRTRVVQGAGQAICQIALGLARAGAAGLVLGEVIGRVAGAGNLAQSVWRRHRAAVSGHSLEEIKATAKEYSSFPRISVPATILHTTTTNFTLLLAPIYGATQYGLYFFGIRFLWAPVSMVAQAMAQVYLGEASRWAREDPALMLRSFDQIVKRLALLGILPFGVLAFFGGPLTAFVFKAIWFEAGILVQIQAVSWWAMFVVGPVINTLNILGRQKWQLWADASGVALMALGFWLSWRFGWSARVAVGLYSGAIFAMYAWLYFACRHAIVRHISTQASNDL